MIERETASVCLSIVSRQGAKDLIASIEEWNKSLVENVPRAYRRKEKLGKLPRSVAVTLRRDYFGKFFASARDT